MNRRGRKEISQRTRAEKSEDDLQNGRYDGIGMAPVEDMVGDLRGAMEQASICGLGMVGANPLGTILRHFPDDLASYARTSYRTLKPGTRSVETPR